MKRRGSFGTKKPAVKKPRPHHEDRHSSFGKKRSMKSSLFAEPQPDEEQYVVEALRYNKGKNDWDFKFVGGSVDTHRTYSDAERFFDELYLTAAKEREGQFISCLGVSYGLIEAIQFNGEGELWDVWWVGHHLPSKETDDNLDAIEYSTLMQAKKIHKGSRIPIKGSRVCRFQYTLSPLPGQQPWTYCIESKPNTPFHSDQVLLSQREVENATRSPGRCFPRIGARTSQTARSSVRLLSSSASSLTSVLSNPGFGTSVLLREELEEKHAEPSTLQYQAKEEFLRPQFHC